MGYQNPRPTAAAFAAIYPPEYGPYQTEVVQRNSMHPDLRRACAFVIQQQQRQRLGGAPQLLDVGCGPGRFLQAMRLMVPDWQLTGIEPDPTSAQAALKAGLMVKASTIEAADLPHHTFDAITLWNVLEHLGDPQAMLQRIRQLLRPQGQLFVAVPLRDSWDARIFGRYWIGWELPRHFMAFDRPRLQRMLAQNGFRIGHTACIDGRSYGFSASLRLLIQDRVKRFTLRRLGEAITYSRPLELALAPYTMLAVALRRCTVLTIAAHLV
jgi:SAM-dependent methyltransferase